MATKIDGIEDEEISKLEEGTVVSAIARLCPSNSVVIIQKVLLFNFMSLSSFTLLHINHLSVNSENLTYELVDCMKCVGRMRTLINQSTL